MRAATTTMLFAIHLLWPPHLVVSAAFGAVLHELIGTEMWLRLARMPGLCKGNDSLINWPNYHRVLLKVLIVTIWSRYLVRLRNPNFLYHGHSSPPRTHPLLCHLNLVHPPLPYCFKVHCNVFLPCTRRSSKRSLPFRFSDQNSVCISRFWHAYFMHA